MPARFRPRHAVPAGVLPRSVLGTVRPSRPGRLRRNRNPALPRPGRKPVGPPTPRSHPRLRRTQILLGAARQPTVVRGQSLVSPGLAAPLATSPGSSRPPTSLTRPRPNPTARFRRRSVKSASVDRPHRHRPTRHSTTATDLARPLGQLGLARCPDYVASPANPSGPLAQGPPTTTRYARFTRLHRMLVVKPEIRRGVPGLPANVVRLSPPAVRRCRVAVSLATPRALAWFGEPSLWGRYGTTKKRTPTHPRRPRAIDFRGTTPVPVRPPPAGKTGVVCGTAVPVASDLAICLSVKRGDVVRGPAGSVPVLGTFGCLSAVPIADAIDPAISAGLGRGGTRPAWVAEPVRPSAGRVGVVLGWLAVSAADVPVRLSGVVFGLAVATADAVGPSAGRSGVVSVRFAVPTANPVDLSVRPDTAQS